MQSSFQTRNSIRHQNENFKHRLKSASPKELKIWGKQIEQLTILGDHVLNIIDKLSDEELADFFKLYKVAELLHDSKIPDDVREHYATTLAALLKQNYEFYQCFADQLAVAPSYKDVVRSQKDPNEKMTIEDIEDDIEIMTLLVNQIKPLIDDFEIKYMFSSRDSDIEKLPFVKRATSKRQKLKNFIIAKKEYEWTHENFKILREYFKEVIDEFNEFLNSQTPSHITYGKSSEIRKELVNIRQNLIIVFNNLSQKNINSILEGEYLDEDDSLPKFGTI